MNVLDKRESDVQLDTKINYKNVHLTIIPPTDLRGYITK